MDPSIQCWAIPQENDGNTPRFTARLASNECDEQDNDFGRDIYYNFAVGNAHLSSSDISTVW